MNIKVNFIDNKYTKLSEYSGNTFFYFDQKTIFHLGCLPLRKIVEHQVTFVKEQCRLDIRKYLFSQRTIK